MNVTGKDMEFETVLARIKLYENVSHDYEVAAILGLSKTALAERKARNSLPTDKLTVFCERECINMNWLLSGYGWTCIPSTSWRASEWIRKQLNANNINKIVIVTYNDEVNGLANGFILEKNNGFISLERSSTISNYMGDGPKVYHELLKLIRDKKVTVGQVNLKEGEALIWDKIDVATTLIEHADFSRDVVADELHVFQPDKHSAKIQEPIDAYRANSETDLAEIVNWLKDNPQDKELILKLIKGRKYIKEAINGFS